MQENALHQGHFHVTTNQRVPEFPEAGTFLRKEWNQKTV